MSTIDNQQKCENYRIQMQRLKHAINQHFLLEALFIEFAIIEDRCESIIGYTGDFNTDKHNTIARKLNKITDMRRSKASLLNKYISEELLSEVRLWKDERNRLMHALMNQVLTSDELQRLAVQGQDIVKTLASKSTSYKRALERVQKKEQGKELVGL